MEINSAARLRKLVKEGGDEDMLAAIDTALAWRVEISKQVRKIMDDVVAEHGGHKHRRLAHVTLCEVLSEALAEQTYLACYKNNQTGEVEHPETVDEGLSTAIRSIHGNMVRFGETLKAQDAGVLDKIMAALKGVE